MLKTLFALTAVLAPTQAAYCSGSPDEGIRTNDFPIFEGDLAFARKEKNAVMYTAGPSNASFPIVHLYGTSYEMGFAQGTILKREVTEFITKTWAYLIDMALEEMGTMVPPIIQAKIVELGFERMLDWCAR